MYPDRNTDLSRYFSVFYSMPQWLVERWLGEYGPEITEGMLQDFLKDRPTTIRCQQHRMNPEMAIRSMEEQGAHLEKAPYLPYAWYLSEYSHLAGLKSFVMGRIVVQDLSSMLVGEVSGAKKAIMSSIFVLLREARAFMWQIRWKVTVMWTPEILQIIKWN